MFNTLLKKHLINRNISQKQLSLLTQIPESTISKFLSNEQEPKFSQMINIIKALGLKPEHFFGGTFRKEGFEIFINHLVLMRPVFEDKQSRMMGHTVFTFNRIKFAMAYSLVKDNQINFVVVHQGSMQADNKPALSAGQFVLIEPKNYTTENVIIEAGTHYSVTHLVEDDNFDIVEHVRELFNNVQAA